MTLGFASACQFVLSSRLGGQLWALCFLVLLCVACVGAQEAEPPPSPKPENTETEVLPGATLAGAVPDTPTGPATDRAGAALRNENVFASKLDTDAQKADNTRMGGSYVLISQPVVEAKTYASEYGQAPGELSVLNRTVNLTDNWHAEVFESLQNSVFNARTFFQAGPVLPSRMNEYGVRFGGGLPRWGFLSGGFGQTKNRGMVNGNALVPLLSERTPLSTDPATRAIVARYLAAYPVQAPNRTDIDRRALNTNAPQTIDAINGNLRWDTGLGAKGLFSLSHSLSRQTIRAFQFVAGQNPDTSIHSHRFRLTYRLTLSDATEVALGAGFTRVRSDLHPEPNAVGPRVWFNNALDGLGPQDQYPLNRAENSFRYGVLAYHRMSGGKHRLTFGGDLYRFQLNGIEQYGIRGDYTFSTNFGRSGIENLLWGTPTSYIIRIGNHNRGFRSWNTAAFFADQWTILPNLQLYMGVNHTLSTVPIEINNLNRLPYGTDGNNFGPRFSFAYRAHWDWIVRGSYALSFGEIFPVTYSQIRYNAPGVLTINVNNPSLTDPLAGIDLTAAAVRTSLTKFSSDLATPYSHQYNLTVQRSFGPVTIELGYLGSRSIKLLNAYQTNRADVVPGIELSTKTIHERRPDPRYYDVVEIVNGGVAYLDAAQLSARFRVGPRFTGGGTFTWGKALDQGVMYNSTAANSDLFGRSQWQYRALEDQKGLSQFDSTRSLSAYGVYHLPAITDVAKPLKVLASNWQLSGVLMIKSGTPFGVNAGADAPGFGNVDGGGGDRPHIVNASILGATIGDPDTSTQILNPAYFRFIAPGELAGNLGRNTFRRGMIFNTNATLSREWKWGGGQRTYMLRFQADAFNLTNHPQFDQPQNQLTSPAFGKITNTLNNGRVLQFGLRLSL